MSEESFFKSDVVVEELQDIQKTYTDLLKMSAGLAEFSPKERLDHIEKTLELIAKQKVFYARLALASHGIELAMRVRKLVSLSLASTTCQRSIAAVTVCSQFWIRWSRNYRHGVITSRKTLTTTK